ncbi:MAG: phosphate/phosphite/phosphonate ABC transporter substrate-binding protein [Clostridia bacterium]|nr:phosphate/phosphite/phosphonate ABC transporter substrate-binding protein [Clostridia bacterium]
MKKILLLLLAVTVILASFAGCSGTSGGKDNTTNASSSTQSGTSKDSALSGEGDTLTMVWYPNESGEELKAARDAIGMVLEKATGKKIQHKLTTDYVIAIEAIATGNAHVAFMGAQGYIEAHNKNPKVIPLVVNSGASGTLKDAMYYSWLNVKKGKESEYMKDGKYTIDNIQGKKFSFVSNSSTSGFKVPSAGIVSHFSKQDKWKNLKSENLIEGGKDKFFSEVLFGGSHQGSAVNLLSGKADVAAFCDTCVANYVELAEGKENTAGAVYRVKKDAVDPFKNFAGQEFVVISVTPVLNAPFAVNTEKLSEKTVKAIKDAMMSDETAANKEIFVPKDSKFKGLFKEKERFVEVNDEWFNPIRELSK